MSSSPVRTTRYRFRPALFTSLQQWTLPFNSGLFPSSVDSSLQQWTLHHHLITYLSFLAYSFVHSIAISLECQYIFVLAPWLLSICFYKFKLVTWELHNKIFIVQEKANGRDEN